MELNLSALEFFFFFLLFYLSSLLPFLFSPLLNLSLSPFLFPSCSLLFILGGKKNKNTQGGKKKYKKKSHPPLVLFCGREKRIWLPCGPAWQSGKGETGGRTGPRVAAGPSLSPSLSPLLSPSPGHAAGCIHAAARVPSAPTLSPCCHRPGAGAPSHLSPSTRQWDGKKRKRCGRPQNPPDGATHGPRAPPAWGNRGTGLPAVSPCPQNREMRGGDTRAARGCHRARAAGGCRGWRGTRRSGDVIEPGTSPSSRPICRGAAAILGSGNLGLSAQAGRGSGQGHGWLVAVVASRTGPHVRVSPTQGGSHSPEPTPGPQGAGTGAGTRLGAEGTLRLGMPPACSRSVPVSPCHTGG